MRDGFQGISHDRVLMRIKDYLQIFTTIGGLVWGSFQVIHWLERMDVNINLLQQQVSALQLVVNDAKRRE